MKSQKRETLVSWAFVGPVIVYYLVLTLVPIYMVFYYSFTDWNGLSETWGKIGFGNYVEIFTDPYYYEPIIRTVIVSAIILFGTVLLALPIAALMAKPLRGMTAFRTIYYIPTVISMAIIAQIVNVWLLPYGGTINNIIEQLGGQAVNFKRNATLLNVVIVLICIWKNLGGSIIILVAAIQGIDKSLYEAASLDGASKFSQFKNITVPMIYPMLTFVLVTGITGIFSIFEPVQLISNGGPDGQTRVVLFSIYEEAFSNFRMGMSNALSVVVFIISMGLTLVSFKVRSKNEKIA